MQLPLVGTQVKKTSGHAFRGIVRSYFYTSRNDPRIVVESNILGYEGLLFILRPDQVIVVEGDDNIDSIDSIP